MKFLSVHLAFFLLCCNNTEVFIGKKKAMGFALSHIGENYPRSLLDLSKTEIEDDGKNYKVIFHIPDEYFGGAPIIWISKKDGKVVKSLVMQ